MQNYKHKLTVGIPLNLIHKKTKKAATSKLVDVKSFKIHQDWFIKLN